MVTVIIVAGLVVALSIAAVLDYVAHHGGASTRLSDRLLQDRILSSTKRQLDGRRCALCGHYNLARVMHMSFDVRAEALVWRCAGCNDLWKSCHA